MVEGLPTLEALMALPSVNPHMLTEVRLLDKAFLTCTAVTGLHVSPVC